MSIDGRPPDDDEYREEPELPEAAEDNSASVLIGVGVVAFVIGLFLWWSVISSFTDSEGSIFDEAVNETPAATQAPTVTGTADVAGEEPLDCDDFGPQRALSPEQEAAYQAQCVSPTPEPEATPTPDTRLNREDCEEIRGTDYRSPEERTWFLANCI